MKTRETKNATFKRLAGNRTNNAITSIRLLGNLSNRNNYSYSEEDFKQIFNSLEDELKLPKSKFLIALSKKQRFKI